MTPAEPRIFPSGSSRPFVPGFPLSVPAPFGLWGRPLSLAAISAALSPHPKIPFLAEKAQRLTSDVCRMGASAEDGLQAVCAGTSRLLPRNGQEAIIGRREIVCLFHGPGIFSWPQPDHQSVSQGSATGIRLFSDGSQTSARRWAVAFLAS
jgi:hypothetical protein